MEVLIWIMCYTDVKDQGVSSLWYEDITVAGLCYSMTSHDTIIPSSCIPRHRQASGTRKHFQNETILVRVSSDADCKVTQMCWYKIQSPDVHDAEYCTDWAQLLDFTQLYIKRKQCFPTGPLLRTLCSRATTLHTTPCPQSSESIT